MKLRCRGPPTHVWIQIGAGLQILWQQLGDLGPNCVGGILAFDENVHGHNATGVHGFKGDFELVRHASVVPGGDEGRIVVGDYAGGVGGEAVEDVVGVGLAAAQIKAVADAAQSQPPRRFGHAF